MKFFTSLIFASAANSALIEVPWQFEFKLPSKTEANNGYMLMNVLRFYLQSQGLTQFIPQVEDMLQYGCWCQILKDRLAGKGVPTDKYDELCRDWQRCNECAVMDFKDVAEGNCAASSTMYEISFDTFTRRVVCDKTTDPCGKAICQCDESLAHNLSQATTLFELVFNESMNFENFDFESNCAWNGTATHDQNDKQCCGEYPTRTPYHHQNNSRACCGGSIIKTDTHCCVDDQALLGSDPSCPL